jgi:hypothetical protein
MTRKEAIACGSKRYFGRVWAKHPELGGERWITACTCVMCNAEYTRASSKTPKGRARRQRYRQTSGFRVRRLMGLLLNSSCM